MKYNTLLSVLALVIASTFTSRAATESKYEINVNDFTELRVVDGLNVDYVCNPDSAGFAVFHATPEVSSMMMFSNNGKNRLTVQLSDDATGKTGLPTVTVYSNFLLQVENTGDSLVRVLSVAPGAKFKATLIGNGRLSVRDITANQVDAAIKTGNGQLVISGRCQNANINNTGTGSIQADGLVATNAKCSVMGTGSIGCHAKENLTIQGMGTGKVYYEGSPEIKNRGMGIKFSHISEEK